MSRLRRLLPALIAVGAVAAAVIWSRLQPPVRTIVLISIDTCRPGRLGVYGNTPDVSPNIDELARSGVVFEHVEALSPWTLPSHMSMLTSLDPLAHGVRRDDNRLSGKIVTLAEALHEEGFRTAAFTDGGFVAAKFGFGAGFEIYRDKMDPGGRPRGFRGTLPEGLQWMRDTRRQDSFVFFHTFDAHTPYDEGDPEILEAFRKRPAADGADDWQLHRLQYLWQQHDQRVDRYGRMTELLNDYDAGVHEADAGVGRILDVLRETGRLENALVIVTSDHGEAFAERGLHIGHGLALTEDELRVPLVVHFPGGEGAGRRLPTFVDLLDIAPTALDVARVPAPDVMQGESLLGLVRGRARQREVTFGESQNMSAAFLVAGGFKLISPPALDAAEVARRHLGPMTPPTSGDLGEEYDFPPHLKLARLRYDFRGDPLGIKDTMPQGPQLYDLVNDPTELHNLWGSDAAPPQARLLATRLAELIDASVKLHETLDDGQAPEPVDVNVPNQVVMLEALGYVGTQGSGATGVVNSVPRLLRDAVTNPFQPPDTDLVVTSDRLVHASRLLLREGLPLPPGSATQLQKLGDRYVAWFTQHLEYLARIQWRIRELEIVGEAAGVSLDAGRWVRRALEIEQHRGRTGSPQAVPPAADPQAPPR